MVSQAGDVGAIPKGMARYVQNLGDEPLLYLEMFRSPRFMDVSLKSVDGADAPGIGAGSPEPRPADDGCPPERQAHYREVAPRASALQHS